MEKKRTAQKWKQKAVTISMSMALCLTTALPAFAAAAPDGQTEASAFAEATGTTDQWNAWQKQWDQEKYDWTKLSIEPGTDESQLNFAWLTKKETSSFVPQLRIGTNKDMTGAKEYQAAQTEVADEKNSNDGNSTYMSNKVTASGLKSGTTYYYQYETADGQWSETASYTIGNPDRFSFIFVGDPQIGSSNAEKGKNTDQFYNAQSAAVESDAFIWSQTLNAALKRTNGKASFVVSAGDQIQTTKKKAPNNNPAVSEIEYTGFLSADALKSLPVATTVGNHDADNANYTYHFNTPNTSSLGSNETAGGDYSFTYGDVLFIDLNTQGTSNDEHKQFIKETVDKNKNAKWKIVVLHQDIYGSAEHSNEPAVTDLRYALVPTFEECGIDLVMTGHDHAYSRSKIMKGAVKQNNYSDDLFDAMLEKDIDNGDSTETLTVAPQNIKDDTTDPDEKAYLNYLNSVMDKNAVQEITGNSSTVIDPDGIVYLTGDSSSGSKYYDLVSRQQSYIASRWQGDAPTYSVIDVTDDTLTMNTYRSDNGETIDTAFTISKGTANKKALRKAAKKASALLKKSTGAKKESSYKVLSAAVKNAKRVLTKKNAVKKDYSNAQKALNDAVNTFKAKPSKAAIKKIKVSGQKAVIKVRKQKEAAGYKIYVSKNKSFRNAKVVKTANTKVSVKKLSSKSKYYVKVRAWKMVGKKHVYGSYSKVKTFHIK